MTFLTVFLIVGIFAPLTLVTVIVAYEIKEVLKRSLKK